VYDFIEVYLVINKLNRLRRNVMLRTEMIDNLLDSYTVRELKALATRLGIETLPEFSYTHSDMVYMADAIHDILFDPGGSYHEFNKLAEMEA